MSRIALATRLAITVSLIVSLPAVAGQAAPETTATAVAPVAAPVQAPAQAQEKVAVSSATAEEAKQITCRTVRITGSNLRTRRVCTTPNSEKNASDWVREQQDRAGINASAIVNAGGGG